MSEAPVITALTLLGDFVTEVGPKPPQDKLTTYVARLREQVRSSPVFAVKQAACSPLMGFSLAALVLLSVVISSALLIQG